MSTAHPIPTQACTSSSKMPDRKNRNITSRPMAFNIAPFYAFKNIKFLENSR